MADLISSNKTTSSCCELQPDKIPPNLIKACQISSETDTVEGNDSLTMFRSLMYYQEMWTRKRIVANTVLSLMLSDLPDLKIPDPLQLDSYTMKIAFPNKDHHLFNTLFLCCKYDQFRTKLLKKGKNANIYPYNTKGFERGIRFENICLLAKEIRRLYKINKGIAPVDDRCFILTSEEMEEMEEEELSEAPF